MNSRDKREVAQMIAAAIASLAPKAVSPKVVEKPKVAEKPVEVAIKKEDKKPAKSKAKGGK